MLALFPRPKEVMHILPARLIRRQNQIEYHILVPPFFDEFIEFHLLGESRSIGRFPSFFEPKFKPVAPLFTLFIIFPKGNVLNSNNIYLISQRTLN